MGVKLSTLTRDGTLYLSQPDATVIPRIGEQIMLDDVRMMVEMPDGNRHVERVHAVAEDVLHYWDTDHIDGVNVVINIKS